MYMMGTYKKDIDINNLGFDGFSGSGIANYPDSIPITLPYRTMAKILFNYQYMIGPCLLNSVYTINTVYVKFYLQRRALII